MRKTFSIPQEILFLVGLSIFAWGPLLTPAYFLQAHDARHSLFYVVEMAQTMRDGYLWPRWSPDFAFGYGYPLFNVYAPLAIYAATVLHLLGLEILSAVKLMYILATLGGGLTMYGFGQRLFNRQAGLVAGVVYMLAPFHLLEIYVRSAYAEYVSLMLLPLILWAFTELIASPSPKRLALSGTGYGLLALTHHSTFFTFTPFLMLYILALLAGRARTNWRSWLKLIAYNAGAGVLGICLAGIYLIPVLLEQKYIKVEQWTSGSYSFLQNFVYTSQFLSPNWGYGYAGPGSNDGMGYQIGLVVFVLLVMALVGLIQFSQKQQHQGTAWVFMGATALSMWLMSPGSNWLWTAIPLAPLVQFPWRLLIITLVSSSVVTGACIAALKADQITVYVLCLIIALGSYAYAQPQYSTVPDWADEPLAVVEWDSFSIKDRVGMVIDAEEQATTSPLEPLYRAGLPLEAGTVIAGSAQAETLHRGGASAEARVWGEAATYQFYTYNFPGWQVRLNGEVIHHWAEGPFGLITVDVPAGEHILSLRMGNTLPRQLGTILSLMAFGGILVLLLGRIPLTRVQQGSTFLFNKPGAYSRTQQAIKGTST